LNSLKSCAASVLFGEMTSVGRCTFAMTFAIVNVLPEPVTPRRATCGRPSRTKRVMASMASG
jgi:hypothetical protein